MCIGIVFGSMYDQTAYGLIIGLLVGAALSQIASDKKRNKLILKSVVNVE